MKIEAVKSFIPDILNGNKIEKQTGDNFGNVLTDFIGQVNQNQLDANHLAKIVETYRKRESVDKYAYLATPEELAENDYNLNIPRYVDTFEEEEEIDLMAVRKEREQLKAELAKLEEQMAGYLKELGYE